MLGIRKLADILQWSKSCTCRRGKKKLHNLNTENYILFGKLRT